MNADRLLGHYEQIADAPDAVQRLRRFILELAVRGKLVKQDPNDEPASVLLKRIAAARMLVPASGRKTKKPFGDSSLTEVAFPLPAGWTSAQLSELVRVVNGRAYKKAELLESGTPVLRVGNLFTSNHWYYSDLELEEDKHCDVGDLIYAWSASFGPFIWQGPRVIYHYHIWKLPLFSEANIDKRFLYFFLLQKTKEIKGAGHGISMAHMTKEKMEQLAVPLAPLAEQHRIVAKVDELMALCDRMEKARAAREATRNRMAAASLVRLNDPDSDPVVFRNHAAFALENLAPLTTRTDQIKSLRQTILNLAVHGKLVEQDPNDEPAAELLKRVAVEKARLVKARELRNPKQVSAINADECFFDSPRGWEWKRLSEISRKIHYGFTASANNMIDAVRLLRITDIQDNSVDWVSVPGCEIGEKALPQFKLEKGDILVARTGGTIGKSFLVQDVPVVAVFASYLIRVQGSHEIYDRYLKLFLESPVYWMQLQDGSRGAGQPNVNGQTLGKMLFPLPPLAEQHRIVVKIDELMVLCDRLEATLATDGECRRRLLDALLHEVLPARRSGGHLTKRKTHTPRAIRMAARD